MSYGNIGFGSGHDARRINPTGAREPNPDMVAEKRRIQNMMSDLAHVTPTGEFVTYAPEPFGDKIRMIKKDLDDGGQGAAQAQHHNRSMTAMLMEDERRRQGLAG
jgi:hypothetical protein